MKEMILKRKIRRLLNYVPVLLLLCCFCSRQSNYVEVLNEAENIVEQQPDSAFRLLNTIYFPEDMNKSRFNKYNLLMLQAKDKSDRDITSDTIIFVVRDYFIQKKDYPNAALAAFYCGRVRYEQKNMDEASNAYMEAEKLADKTDDYNLKGLILGNFGILHREHSSHEKAIELNKKAVAMYDKAKNYKNKIVALKIIGDCFALSKKIDSAFYYYDESLKLTDSYNMPERQASIKNSMGVAYREQGFYGQAKKLFNEALAFPNDSVEQAKILLNIAQVYVLEDNADSVNLYLDKAFALQINNPWLIRTSYFLRSTIEEKKMHYKEALNYHKEFYQYTMKVFDSEKNNRLLEIQGKYDFEKIKSSKIELIIRQQKTVTMLSLALLVAGIIIFVYYRKSTQNEKLLLETEQKIASLQKMADYFPKENHDFRNILLEQFDILRKTALLKTLFSEEEQASGQKLLKKFNEIVYGQVSLDWDKLYQVIDNLKHGLYSKIRSKYPQLSKMEFRICCLSCETGFSDKEIGIILGTTFHMVRRIRSDMRKKIDIPKGEDFLVFFERTIR